MMEKLSLFLVLALEGLVDLQKTICFSFSGISDWGINLDYCDIEWFALETNRDHFVVFETAPKYCISNSFVDYEDYSISSKGFLPTVVGKMGICDQYRRWVQSLGWEYSLEKETATHCSILT